MCTSLSVYSITSLWPVFVQYSNCPDPLTSARISSMNDPSVTQMPVSSSSAASTYPKSFPLFLTSFHIQFPPQDYSSSMDVLVTFDSCTCFGPVLSSSTALSSLIPTLHGNLLFTSRFTASKDRRCCSRLGHVVPCRPNLTYLTVSLESTWIITSPSAK